LLCVSQVALQKKHGLRQTTKTYRTAGVKNKPVAKYFWGWRGCTTRIWENANHAHDYCKRGADHHANLGLFGRNGVRVESCAVKNQSASRRPKKLM
jgi:hypothetical protein